MKSAKLKNAKKAIALFFIPALLLVLGPFIAANSSLAEAASIKKVEVKDNLLQIGIDGPFTYTMYNTDPYKVIVEFPGVSAGSFAGQMDAPKVNGITSVSVSDDSKRAKVQVLLDSPANVKPAIDGGVFDLAIQTAQVQDSQDTGNVSGMQAGNSGAGAGISNAAAEDTAIENASASTDASDVQTGNKTDVQKAGAGAGLKATAITSLKFERTANSVDLVIAGNGTLKTRIFSLRDRIVVDLYGIGKAAPEPEKVISPIKAIRSSVYPGKLRLVIDIKKNTQYQAMSVDDTLRIIMPVSEKTPGTKTETKEVVSVAEGKKSAIEKTSASTGPTPKPGQKISLDFEDAQIVPIFMLLGQVGGYNVVVSPNVQGTITLKLKDVPWEQALDILLNTFSLGKRIEGNVMTIAPLSQFAAWSQAEEKLKESNASVEDTVQEVIKLNYATAADVTGDISSAKLLSPRGNITTDTRTNTLIIKDIPSQIDKIKNLVGIIDIAKPQVMIEAQIVEVDSSFTESLGVRWGGTQNIAGVSGQSVPFGQPGFQQNFNFSANTPVATAGATVGTAASPVGAAAFALGTANALSLQLSLEALETVNHAKSLANPRVLTIDNEAASIQQGTSIPVQTTTAAGTTTQYVNANLNLTVTPRITPDGYVQLKITAANDSLGQVTAQGYAINKKSVDTQAMVKNGETLVIGGIYTTNENTSVSGIPLLDKIPLLGALFKTRTVNGPNPSELLILITPRIVKNQ